MEPLAPLPQSLPPSGKRVIAAMSGGVDSSVVAKLLVEKGYDVLGVTLKLYSSADLPTGEDGEALDSSCCSLADVEDARSVAWNLGIHHRTFNFSDQFGTLVIDRFCESYLNGQTPNPCIDCNRFIKFSALQQRRAELEFDYVATGHYARVCFDEASGRYLLKTGRDINKDQSYVLYSLTQDELAHTLFPLGELTKQQVRVLAGEAHFVNAQKAESQDICFIPEGNYRNFIKHRTGRTLPPGPIVNPEGTILGTHTGLDCYTIGQRKGIGIAAPEPLYVCRKDMDKNELVVGTAQQATCVQVNVENINWISVERLENPIPVTAKTFYRQKALPAILQPTGPNTAALTFTEPIRACAPGQAAVFYQEDCVLGGGTITGCS